MVYCRKSYINLIPVFFNKSLLVEKQSFSKLTLVKVVFLFCIYLVSRYAEGLTVLLAL